MQSKSLLDNGTTTKSPTTNSSSSLLFDLDNLLSTDTAGGNKRKRFAPVPEQPPNEMSKGKFIASLIQQSSAVLAKKPRFSHQTPEALHGNHREEETGNERQSNSLLEKQQKIEAIENKSPPLNVGDETIHTDFDAKMFPSLQNPQQQFQLPMFCWFQQQNQQQNFQPGFAAAAAFYAAAMRQQQLSKKNSIMVEQCHKEEISGFGNGKEKGLQLEQRTTINGEEAPNGGFSCDFDELNDSNLFSDPHQSQQEFNCSSPAEENDCLHQKRKLGVSENGGGRGSVLTRDPTLMCAVCGDASSGKHYGILACNGCSGFFKRSVRRQLIYRCQTGAGNCQVDKAHRNQCQYCRLNKCFAKGMNKDAVQNERQPRNAATIQLNGPEDLGRFFTGHASHATRMFRSTILPTTHDFSTPNKFDVPSFSGNNGGHQQQNQDQQQPDSSTSSSGGGGLGKDKEKVSALRETATRLLHIAVRYAKAMPSFAVLVPLDQLALLQASWADLIILTALQFSISQQGGGLLEEEHLLEQDCSSCPLIEGPISTMIPQEVRSALKSLFQKFRQFCVDPAEFACLHAIILFKPEVPDLRNPVFVEQLQDQAMLMLQQHASRRGPSLIRFGRLLLLLLALKSVASNNAKLEMLFFNGSQELSGNLWHSPLSALIEGFCMNT